METTMLELLQRLAWTSVQSALLVALVWTVCRALPGLPAAARCRLWWLVGAQALLGLVWSAPLQLAVLPAPDVPVATMSALPTAALAIPALADTAPLTHAAAAPEAGLSWAGMLVAAWALGVGLMLARSAYGYRRSRQLVHSAARCTDRSLIAALQLAANAHGLRRAPTLMLSAHIDSPQLIGPWSPVLLLPARRLPQMSADDLDMALTHELVHLQRRDLWFGLVPALAQHLFFFHPLVHLAAREYAVAREGACDAQVVAGHRHCRHHYGRLLLQLGIAPRPQAGLASASADVHALKRRLQMLQQRSGLPRVLTALITGVFVLVGVVPLRLVAAPAEPAMTIALNGAVVSHTGSTAPVTPAPIVAPAPVVAPAAAVPAVPAVLPPEAPEAPVPAAPADSISTNGRVHLGHAQPRAFVLVDGQQHFADATVDELRQASRAARAAGGSRVLWFRDGRQRYLVSDAALLAPVDQQQAKLEVLGRQLQLLGDRQTALAEQVAAESQRIERAAAQAVSAALAKQGASAQPRDAAQRAEQAAAAALAASNIEAVAQQQASIAVEQAHLAQQQAQVSERAQRLVEQVMQQAVSSGKARRLD